MYKICVFSSSRADYGLLRPLLKMMHNDSGIDLHIMATGTHLCKNFGQTVWEIEQDGFSHIHKIPIPMGTKDDACSILQCISKCVTSFADALIALQPDYVLVLGDRFEIFAAVQTAYILGIRIGHIHGGELTYGALDDGFRHAMTKLSHDHFPSHIAYGNRIIQMGESPDSVFVCGAPGMDNLITFQKEPVEDFQKRIGLDFCDHPLFLVTYHPETVFLESLENNLQDLFKALDVFSDARILFTKANADPGGRFINEKIDHYCSKNKERMVAHTSLGQEGYYQALSYANVMIGNSSSALIEANYFNVPVVNIGCRQDGRLRHASVIDCGHKDIFSAIEQALYDEEWQKNNLSKEKLFGIPGHISALIVEHIKKSLHRSLPLHKTFYDQKKDNF